MAMAASSLVGCSRRHEAALVPAPKIALLVNASPIAVGVGAPGAALLQRRGHGHRGRRLPLERVVAEATGPRRARGDRGRLDGKSARRLRGDLHGVEPRRHRHEERLVLGRGLGPIANLLRPASKLPTESDRGAAQVRSAAYVRGGEAVMLRGRRRGRERDAARRIGRRASASSRARAIARRW